MTLWRSPECTDSHESPLFCQPLDVHLQCPLLLRFVIFVFYLTLDIFYLIYEYISLSGELIKCVIF